MLSMYMVEVPVSDYFNVNITYVLIIEHPFHG